jgi:glutathione S-transferase
MAVHTYVADLAGSKELLPAHGTIERAEAMNWLSFFTTDLHKSVGALWGLPPFQREDVRSVVREVMIIRTQQALKYLMGDIPITPYKNIQAYMARVAARPAVAKVLKEEGLR